MTKAFALKISMKALFFFVVFLQYNKNRGRLTDLLDSPFTIVVWIGSVMGLGLIGVNEPN